MKTLQLKTKSFSRLSLRHGLILIALVLACFALLPTAQAIPPPTPPPHQRVEGDLGNGNTVEGNGLSAVTTGTNNTAMGNDALFRDTAGSFNTATGWKALLNNNSGEANTAVGAQALQNNTGTADFNTAVGAAALLSNTGHYNTAVGDQALINNSSGSFSTAVGEGALNNSTADDNTALGALAGSNLTTGGDNIDIGNFGVAGEGGTIRIGDGNQIATYIAGIYGVDEGGTIAQVTINSDGQLGTQAVVMTSSRRFKKEIKPMDEASEVIFALKPVTFQFKKEIDPKGIPQFGLVAEEVEKVKPDLITRDRDGKPYAVRYDAVNAMLLNEFLKEHRRVEQLQKAFESKIADQQKQIEALTAGLQKVSAQVELKTPAPQTVANNQ